MPARLARPVRREARSRCVLHAHPPRLPGRGRPARHDRARSFRTDLANGTLPAFSFVTPNLCHDTHDCPVAEGDAWLRSWVPRILASPNYLAGDTVVFLTWDEDDGSASNRVALIVVSPSTRPGTESATSFDHYSLLKTAEQLLGIRSYLGHAGDAGTASLDARVRPALARLSGSAGQLRDQRLMRRSTSASS